MNPETRFRLLGTLVKGAQRHGAGDAAWGPLQTGLRPLSESMGKRALVNIDYLRTFSIIKGFSEYFLSSTPYLTLVLVMGWPRLASCGIDSNYPLPFLRRKALRRR